MTAFLVRRALSGMFVVALLVFLTFFVFNEIPTNPACLIVACGPHTTTTDAMIVAADHRLGIDRSVFVQFGDWVWHVVAHGDFGSSWTTQQHVASMLGDAVPVTASLVLGGMVLMLLLAIPFGSLAAVRVRRPLDHGLLAVSVIGIAIHPFVLGVIVRDFFGRHLHVYDFSYCPLTSTSRPSGAVSGSSIVVAPGGCGGPLDWASHLAVPWVVFALLFLPLYLRMTRVRLLETLGDPYVATARAKGASEPRVVVRHALRNALGPIVPMLAVDAGTAITAAIYVETVFGMQGVGALAVRALSGVQGGFDLPLIAGVVAVVGTFVVLLDIAADVGGAWLDPRVRRRAVSGLIPLPPSLSRRPRARLVLNVAFAALAVGLVAAAAVANRGGSSRGVAIAPPVHVLRVGWDDVYRVGANVPVPGIPGTVPQTGYLALKVSRIELGRRGWRVHASLTNVSPLRIGVKAIAPPNVPLSYPLVPFSLVVQTDRGTGVKNLEPLPATEMAPAIPTVLKPHATWRGTFAGPDAVEPKTLLYVGFGQFSYLDAFGAIPFAATSIESAKAP